MEESIRTLGFKASYQVTDAVLVVAKAGWEHQFADAPEIGANFAGATGAGFTFLFLRVATLASSASMSASVSQTPSPCI